MLHSNSFLNKEIAFVRFSKESMSHLPPSYKVKHHVCTSVDLPPTRRAKLSRPSPIIFTCSGNLERKGAFRLAPRKNGWSWGALPLTIRRCYFICAEMESGVWKITGLLEMTRQGRWPLAVVSKGSCNLLQLENISLPFTDLHFCIRGLQTQPLSPFYLKMWLQNCSEPAAGVLRVDLTLGPRLGSLFPYPTANVSALRGLHRPARGPGSSPPYPGQFPPAHLTFSRAQGWGISS